MKKNKSILMVIPNFYPTIGGAEKQCFELSSALASMGFDVSVLTRLIKNTIKEEKINSFIILRKKVFGPIFLDSIIFMFKVFFFILKENKKFDIVHIHMLSSHSIGAYLACRLKNKKIIFTSTGGKDLNEFTMSNKTFLGKLKLFLLKFFKGILLVKNLETLKWLKENNYNNFEIKLFKNGVDTYKYKVARLDEKEKAKKILNAKKINILFVGRLSYEKNIKEFIEIFAEILSEELLQEVSLMIVGEGPLEKQMKETCKTLKIEDKVIFCGKQNELSLYYNASEIFVLPSISEGLSNSMLEAMSSGLVILASNVGGAKDIIKNDYNGCLFNPLNINEIKNCIRKLINCKDFNDIATINRKIIVENFSINIVVSELIKIYGF